ncbi:uncharacterized protein TNCV_5029651 [Trichonephila clavipes]|nr:uncharacterized protein TNCV_5029651 [Trichonephila clavipes]
MPLRTSHSQIEEQIDTFIQNFKRNSAVFVSNFNLENYGATLRHTFSAGQLSPTARTKRYSFLSAYSSSSRRTSVDGTNSSFSEGESFYHDDADISESSSDSSNLKYMRGKYRKKFSCLFHKTSLVLIQAPVLLFIKKGNLI